MNGNERKSRKKKEGKINLLSKPSRKDSQRYDEQHYLCAHNAFAYRSRFKGYYQQNLTLYQQLKYGVRAFMLDAHWYKGDIYLAHGKANSFLHGFQLGFWRGLKGWIKGKYDYEKLDGILHLFTQWLNAHPNKVLTIFFEMHITSDQLWALVKRMKDVRKLILTPRDWNPYENDGCWPTLEWMRKKNKRLVIFCGTYTTNFYYTWYHVKETNYSTTDPMEVCKSERHPSYKYKAMPRKLVLYNYFPRVQTKGIAMTTCCVIDYKVNSMDSLEKLTKTCQKLKFGGRKKWPNFIALDFVELGDGRKFVSKLQSKQ